MDYRVEALVPVIEAHDDVNNLPVVTQIHGGELWAPVARPDPG
jgi:hypothetical protein